MPDYDLCNYYSTPKVNFIRESATYSFAISVILMLPLALAKKYFNECLAGYVSLCAMTTIWFVLCEVIKFKDCSYAQICLYVLLGVSALLIVAELIWLVISHFKT